MNATFVQPAMQREGINSQGTHNFGERNEAGTFPTIMAVGRRLGTTIPGEDRFRGFDGDFAYHSFPPFQEAPCLAGEIKQSLPLRAEWLRIRGNNRAPHIGRYALTEGLRICPSEVLNYR